MYNIKTNEVSNKENLHYIVCDRDTKIYKKKRILVVFVMPKKMLVNVFCYDISHKSQVVFFSAVYSVYTFIGAEHRVLCVLCTHPIVT